MALARRLFRHVQQPVIADVLRERHGHGLVFLADLARQGELSAADVINGTRQASGIIHPGIGPAGYGRFRTDTTSNLQFTFTDRIKFGTGPFTYAVHGSIERGTFAYTLIGNLSSGVSNQARLLTNFNGSASSSGHMCLFTFAGGASTLVAAANVIEADKPQWYVAVRTEAGALQLWTGGILRAETTGGVIRDVSGTHGNPPQMGYGASNSQHRCITVGAMWNRALSAAEIQELQFASDVAPRRVQYLPIVGVSVSGTAADGLTESEVVDGGKTIILTVAGDTWVTAGATFDAQRQAIIDGITSAQSEAAGWNAEVRDAMAVTAVVRTSDTVVTVTLPAAAGYDVDANETITVTVPAAALTGGVAKVASPSFTVTAAAFVGGWIATRPMLTLGAG